MKLNKELYRTPQMGWNSWNHFDMDISEEVIREIADSIKRLQLDKFGYIYVNLDDGWALPERGEDGHVIVHPLKFPNGIKHLSDYVHGLDLKIGIYSDAGVFTCGG